MYGMKLKSYMLKVVKKWYSNIVILRQKHKLLVVMRDNAGENKSQEVVDFSSQWESRTITVPLTSNGKMDFRKPQLIPS